MINCTASSLLRQIKKTFADFPDHTVTKLKTSVSLNRVIFQIQFETEGVSPSVFKGYIGKDMAFPTIRARAIRELINEEILDAGTRQADWKPESLQTDTMLKTWLNKVIRTEVLREIGFINTPKKDPYEHEPAWGTW
ncbi:hypothetical protein F1188_16190 [Roseospira marina]|uniref:Uncharacterized protein n=1 Tax=Roseospira marina TaxID=140057 RepID=A0A5M6I9L0_9PROT|nr:hypothetical protein [Roseospira marina]KAA5604399.1 hypothetical protein F1188_16190 [Roseospira marina]MBB4315410.1 hypothetical protein [Roseospira marina]MBB5088445.1 hypothetical protein [Roseospira marina]